MIHSLVYSRCARPTVWATIKLRMPLFGACGLAIISLAGCLAAGTKATVTEGQDAQSIQETQAQAYNGPQARVAVARFEDKTGHGGWWNGEIGDGMADQLATALFNSNRYIVLERENLDAVLTEQDLGVAGRIREDTAAAIGEIEGAELLVIGAVTEFEGQASGADAGIGAGIGGAIGGLLGGFRKAHMAVDLRVVDAQTSRILAATSVEGEATDVSVGGLVGGYFGTGALAGGINVWKNTPTEKALRIVIQEAVEFMVSKTPQAYYRHGAPQFVVEQPSAVQPATVQPTGTDFATLQPTALAPASGGDLSASLVTDMQNRLAQLGYDAGLADGLMSAKTLDAVSQFQGDYGLSTTGQLDPSTMAKLREFTR